MTVRKKARDPDIRRDFHTYSPDIMIGDEETAMAAGVSASTIRRWRKAGLLKTIMIGGRPRRSVGDVRELLKGQTPGTSD
jgi:hypothetical protein